MKGAMLPPCAEWAVLLAANPEALVPAQRQALAAHLAGCQVCQSVKADYARQNAFLREQPVPAPLEDLPPLPLAAWAAEEGRRQPAPRTNGPLPQSERRAWRRSRWLPVLFSTVAAMLVVALLITALVVSRLPSGTQPHPTAQRTQTPVLLPPTATTAPDGTWVPVPALSQLSGEPIIAPSNPNILYQIRFTDHQTTQLTLSRSEDGGVTWQSLPVPPVVTDLFGASLGISSLDPQVLLLSISNYETSPTSCPRSTATAGVMNAYSGFNLCSLTYVSRDGGSHWQRPVLPLSAQDGSDDNLSAATGNLGAAAGPYLRAQGARLYALHRTTGGDHLMVSEDGGLTWRVDDAGIGAARRYLCDAMPAPDGAVIFALVFTQPCGGGGSEEFWRSDDAGATWHQAGPLPGNVQSFIVSSQGAKPMPLVYVLVPDPGSVPFDVKMSSDGGVTWRAAPWQGTLYITGLLGVLSDGTLLASVVRPLPEYTYSDPFLYRWKPGETIWHQVASTPIHGLDYLLVLEHPETIWIVQYLGFYTAQQLRKT